MMSLEELNQKATAMRTRLTFSEERAMNALVGGPAFEMQVVFGFYILDFIIPSKLLVVEIDGESHLVQREHDKRRDAFCEQFGLTVLRIPNNLANTAGLRAAKYPDAAGYAKAWAKALRGAAKEQARAEAKASVPTPERKAQASANQAARNAIRNARIAIVQGLPSGASGKDVLNALNAKCPRKGQKQKKKTPENRQARIDAASVKQQAKKEYRHQALVAAGRKPAKPARVPQHPVPTFAQSPVLAQRRAERLAASIATALASKPATAKPKKRKGLSFSQSLANLTNQP